MVRRFLIIGIVIFCCVFSGYLYWQKKFSKEPLTISFFQPYPANPVAEMKYREILSSAREYEWRQLLATNAYKVNSMSEEQKQHLRHIIFEEENPNFDDSQITLLTRQEKELFEQFWKDINTDETGINPEPRKSETSNSKEDAWQELNSIRCKNLTENYKAKKLFDLGLGKLALIAIKNSINCESLTKALSEEDANYVKQFEEDTLILTDNVYERINSHNLDMQMNFYICNNKDVPLDKYKFSVSGYSSNRSTANAIIKNEYNTKTELVGDIIIKPNQCRFVNWSGKFLKFHKYSVLYPYGEWSEK